MKNEFIIKDFFNEERKVKLQVAKYLNNGNTYIGLTKEDDSPYGDVTVNLGIDLPEYFGFIDTNNNPNAESFILDNELGENTGMTMPSGFCVYPLYKFNQEKLENLV